MRISDWSSDVCSSDLGPRTLQHRMQRSVRRRARTIVRIGRMPVKPIATSDMRRQRKTARNVRQAARRSEESRVGKESVSTGRSRWSPYYSKKNKKKKQV